MKMLVAAMLAMSVTMPAWAQSDDNHVYVPSKKEKAAAAVRIVGVERELERCKYLKDIRATELFWGGAFSYDILIDKMKRRVMEAGGNTLFIVNAGAQWGGSAGVGIAYKC